MISGWKDELQQDYLDFLRTHRRASPSEMAAHLNVSECSAVFWLTDLARDGRVRILAVELIEEGSLPREPQGALTDQGKAFRPVRAAA